MWYKYNIILSTAIAVRGLMSSLIRTRHKGSKTGYLREFIIHNLEKIGNLTFGERLERGQTVEQVPIAGPEASNAALFPSRWPMIHLRNASV